MEDVIVDQFDVVGLGGIALETMAMAKPVFFKQVISCRDRNNLRRIGLEAQRWVYQNHSWETCIEQFLFYYSLLTGHQVVDYGWHKNPYRKEMS